MRLAPLLLASALAFASGCCRDPWSAYPASTPPDASCEVGGAVAGWDVYVWTCAAGEHVVVAQYSAEMTCQAAIRESAPCGATTPFERDHDLAPGACKGGARSGREWPTR